MLSALLVIAPGAGGAMAEDDASDAKAQSELVKQANGQFRGFYKFGSRTATRRSSGT